MSVPSPISRRDFLASSTAATVFATGFAAEPALETRQAMGVKVGEVTDSSAIVWTRLTATPSRCAEGAKVVGKPMKDKNVPLPDVAMLHGRCDGAEGFIRVRHGRKADLSDAVTTDWQRVNEKGDFSHSFSLTGLPADTLIHYVVETTDVERKPHGPFSGSFRTAPKADADAEITFAMMTCQMFADLDHVDGFHIYPAIQKLDPRFVVFAGDNVYYDGELPLARNVPLARYHWQRMYSLPRHVALLRRYASYWLKDDHDTLKNDCWAGQMYGALTFADGLRIFREQVPMGEKTYRTFRWGKALQVWFTEGRDFRSPNNLADGPNKTILGKEQKEWLFRTLQESEAAWKLIISPTPIVGPDRENKGDNHANRQFQHEGDELRAWIQKHIPKRCFVLCGDRHWQYHSVHPKTGVHEFSVGAASDSHAGGSPGENKEYHRFHRVKGGFLSVVASSRVILFRHHDVTGQVVYTYETKSV